MNLAVLFAPELIHVGRPKGDLTDEAAIRTLCELLEQRGAVGPAYTRAVLARERTFPTGLPTAPYGVAIPHADPIEVHRSAIAVLISPDPIPFGEMANPNGRVGAHIVLLLAIKDAKQQPEALAALFTVIQNPDRLKSLLQPTAAQVYQALHENFRP